MIQRMSHRILVAVLCFSLLLGLFGCVGNDLVISDLFSENLLAVQKDGRWGYINKTGKTEIDFFYDQAGAFYNGIAVVVQNSRYFLIDKEGKRLLDKAYDYLELDGETGLVWFNVDGAQGLMNAKGVVLADPVYDLIFGPTSSAYFVDGLASVAIDDKYGYLNPSGDLVIPTIYDYADDFSEGLAVVLTEGEYGYINKDGDIIINAIYYDAYSFNTFNQAIVSTYNTETSIETFKVIDKTGADVFGGYDDINETPFGYVGTLNDLFYLIDTEGVRVDNVGYDDYVSFFDYVMTYIETTDRSIIFDKDYEVISDFTGDEFPDDAFVDLEVLYFIYEKEDSIEITYKGKTVSLTCDGVDDIVNGKVVAIKYGMRGLVDLRDNVNIEYNYDTSQIFDDGYMLVSINGFYGIVNENVDTIIPLEYSNCNTSIYL